MSKILFLDIDGVLNHVGSYIYVNEKGGQNGGACFGYEYCEFCPISCSNLRYVMKEVPDLKIVVSSTWRLMEWDKLLLLLKDKAGLDIERVIGKTPRMRDKEWDVKRGTEIQKWLDDNKEAYPNPVIVILDDDSDMEHLKDRLVKTSSNDGFTYSKVKEVMLKLEDGGTDGVS